MSSSGPNLPLVIQQSGDASRLQDVVQRLGEEQQALTEMERRRQAERQKSQVQQTDRSDGQNRVRADADGGREGRRRKPAPAKRRAAKADEPEAQPAKPNGVINVVV